MRRIGLAVVVTVVCLTGPLTAQQLTRVPRIGVLVNADSPRVEAFRHGLREQGYTDGRNVFIEYRYASARSESLDVLARELMHLKVDVIVTEGTPPTLAARRATDSIPIVVTSAGDLVGAGLVASLARPGGNVTGLTLQSPELSGKRLALLRDLVPSATAVAMLLNRRNRVLHPLIWQETETAAKALRITLHRFEIERPDDFEAAFAEMVKQRTVAVLVPLDPMFNDHRERLIGLAAKSRLPAMFGERLHVDAGGLVSYGPNYAALYRRAATYVDKILRGAKPADLPVEQPTSFELVINAKTAKALGLTIPQTLLLRADEILQ
jgi:putative tryptophan/tyrosine transport system substrate-binding protein